MITCLRPEGEELQASCLGTRVMAPLNFRVRPVFKSLRRAGVTRRGWFRFRGGSKRDLIPADYRESPPHGSSSSSPTTLESHRLILPLHLESRYYARKRARPPKEHIKFGTSSELKKLFSGSSFIASSLTKDSAAVSNRLDARS